MAERSSRDARPSGESHRARARGLRRRCCAPLAFEALSNRIGDLAKRLVDADQARFADLVWRQAARNRDFVVHHYDRLDSDLLWRTVTTAFPLLAALVHAEISTDAGREAPRDHDGP